MPIKLLSLCLISIAVFAQENTGTIVGTISDATGAPVPNAKVEVRNTDRNLVMLASTTNETGNYVATLLPVGNYSVSVEVKGFKKATKSAIELHVASKLTISVNLEIGDLTEQVTVEASAVQVELQSATSAGLIDGTEIRELSLNNRNFMQLIALMPGVTSNSATDEMFIGTTNPLGGTNTIPFAINGGRTSGNNIMIDGADNVDRGSNLTILSYPSVDAIAEFKVLRGQYSAEFGRGSTGQVNVITKSGQSKFHGSAYEFFRNDLLAGNNFFNNLRGIKRPPYRYNNFGYTFSGPVAFGNFKKLKNKTFFFWSQEFHRVITYGTFNPLLPTDNLKKGIFSTPVCVESSGTTCTSFATEIRNINPVSAAYIKDIWSKVPAGDAGNFNYFQPLRSTFNHRQELIKFDHVINERHSISARYIRDTIPTVEPGGLFTGSGVPGVATTATDSPGRGLMVRATSTLTSNLLNEAGFSYSYGAIVSRPIGLIGTEQSPDIKAVLPFTSTLNRVPTLSVSGFSSLTGYGPYDDFNRNYNMFDNLTKILKRQTVKFGASYNFYQKTENAAGNNVGAFTIANTFGTTARPSTTNPAQQAWANFLLGNVATFTQTSLDLTPDIRAKQFEAYVQDDVRLRSNFTLNIGLRYSNYRQPYDAKGMLTTFDPSRFDLSKAPQIVATNGNIVPNTGDPLNGIIDNNKTSPYGGKVANENNLNFAPRIGFAWDPFRKGKTAIRSGYGLSYDSTLVGIYEQNIFANPPYLNNVTISNTRIENAAAGLSVISAAPKTLRGTAVESKTPYTQQWSFEIQQQLTNNFVLSVGYVGTKSTHLLGIVDMNMARPGAAVAAGIVSATTPINAATTPLLNAIRPFRGYGPINVIQDWFNSNYNALQVSAHKRFSSNSNLRFSYTFSKVLTGATSDRSNAPQNFYDRSADYARATFDRTHVASINYVYQIPYKKKNVIIGGWQLSGILAFNSGLPVRVTSGLGLDWAGLGYLGTSAVSPRPDLVSDPNTNAPHTLAKWFNTEAFAPVPTGQLRPGNAAATTVIGPGAQRLDLSMFKNVTLHERLRLQVRFETFNTLNHTNFQSISTSFPGINVVSTFGQVTSTRDARKVQIAMKLTF